MARLDALDDQLLHAKWLPSPDQDDSCLLHRFIVAVGVAGQLHVFDSSGARLLSHLTGHQNPIKGETAARRSIAIQKCASMSHSRVCILSFSVLHPIEPSRAQKMQFTTTPRPP